MRAVIVVLGDFGRSPRMQYHALALANSGVEVDVIAFSGSAPFEGLANHPHIHLRLFDNFEQRGKNNPDQKRDLLGALKRLMVHNFRLIRTFWRLPARPDLIMVQNPPAFPTLPIALMFARMYSAKLVIDWHNFTSSMFALGLGAHHPAVRLLHKCEGLFCRRADAHLCVSRAMRADLRDNWGIPEASVLYDRPARFFIPPDAQAKKELCTRTFGGRVAASDPLPALVVSPTSWTRDEEMALLLDAAELFDRRMAEQERASQSKFPGMIIAITGKGPMHEVYEKRIERMSLQKVQIRTLWLSPEDYRSLLASSDLGVCCHRSASGLDLPMKICDLIGAGVPVCALNYGPCLREQLHDGSDGLLFENANQLADRLFFLFKDFPSRTAALDNLRNNLARSHTMTWFEGWNQEARPLLMGLASEHSR
jgi:beta-1,4-mannosyltransferase